MTREEAVRLYELAMRGPVAIAAGDNGAPACLLLSNEDRARAASFLRKIAGALDPQEQEDPAFDADMTVLDAAEALGADEVVECPNVFAGAQMFVERHKRDKERKTRKADK